MYFETISFLSALSFSWTISLLLAGLSPAAGLVCAQPRVDGPISINVDAMIATFIAVLLFIAPPLCKFLFVKNCLRLADTNYPHRFQILGFRNSRPSTLARTPSA